MKASAARLHGAEADPVTQETAQRITAEVEASVPPGVPLCVDLDGTLVKSDTLLDTVVVLARQNPRALISFPKWVAEGKRRSSAG